MLVCDPINSCRSAGFSSRPRRQGCADLYELLFQATQFVNGTQTLCACNT